jgi:hypothetical protein
MENKPNPISGVVSGILAIGSTVPLSPDDVSRIMPREIRETVALYLDGKISHWWSRRDAGGVVFVLNSSSVEEAAEMLATLPLGVAKKISFQLIPLGPLAPMRILIRDQVAGGK